MCYVHGQISPGMHCRSLCLSLTNAGIILLSVVVRTTHMWSPPTSLNGTASTYAYHFGVALRVTRVALQRDVPCYLFGAKQIHGGGHVEAHDR